MNVTPLETPGLTEQSMMAMRMADETMRWCVSLRGVSLFGRREVIGIELMSLQGAGRMIVQDGSKAASS